MENPTLAESGRVGLPVDKAIVFDCDGTLLDSESAWLSMFDSLIKDWFLNPSELGEIRGISAAEAADRISRVLSRDVVEVRREIDDRYSAELVRITSPLDGVEELLASIVGVVPLAVATNGRRSDVETMLERAKIRHYFDALVTIEDVFAGKPDPEIYKIACKRLGAAPSETIVFEDSAVGARAAALAGCAVIGLGECVPTELTIATARDLSQVGFDSKGKQFSIRNSR